MWQIPKDRRLTGPACLCNVTFAIEYVGWQSSSLSRQWQQGSIGRYPFCGHCWVKRGSTVLIVMRSSARERTKTKHRLECLTRAIARCQLPYCLWHKTRGNKGREAWELGTLPLCVSQNKRVLRRPACVWQPRWHGECDRTIDCMSN